MANEINSVAGQLVGLPLAGPESFSQQQLDYLKRALGVDETVLWSGSQDLTLNTEITLSETYKNFERIRFECSRTGLKRVTEFNTYDDGVHNAVTLLDCQVDSSAVLIIDSVNISLANAVKPKVAGVCRKTFSTSTFTSGTGSPQTLIRVVGIHRIAGGN